MTPTTKPSPGIALVAVALYTAVWAYALYYLVTLDTAPALVPFLIGAALLPVTRRLRWWVGLLAYGCAVGALYVFYSDAAFSSAMAGIATWVVVAAPILLAWHVGRTWRGRNDRQDPTAGAGGTGDRIIALSGYAGSGKDTAAAVLTENGWTRVSFADKLREFALAVDPLVPVVNDVVATAEVAAGVAPSLRVERLSNLVARVGWTEAKKNPEVRGLLQRIGTDAGRKILGENVWVDAAMADLPAGNIVITDARFPNEAEAVRAAGGRVVRVMRPGVTAVNAHESETALDRWRFDGMVVNDGPPERAQRRLHNLVSSYA